MKFTLAHNNINVIQMERSLDFYKNALGLSLAREQLAADASFRLCYLTDGTVPHLLELTYLRDWEKPQYDLGDNEMHLAFTTPDFDAAHALHAKMGCICFENPSMGIYFIADPDGYWIEILPAK